MSKCKGRAVKLKKAIYDNSLSMNRDPLPSNLQSVHFSFFLLRSLNTEKKKKKKKKPSSGQNHGPWPTLHIDKASQ